MKTVTIKLRKEVTVKVGDGFKEINVWEDSTGMYWTKHKTQYTKATHKVGPGAESAQLVTKYSI